MKYFKPLFVLALAIILVLSMQVSVSALLYHQTDANGLLYDEFTPRLTTDPYYIQYYISPSVNISEHVPYISIGIESWNSSEYDIDIIETSSYSSSVCDVRGYDGASSVYEDQSSLLGFAVVYCGDGAYSGDNTAYYNSEDIPEDYWMGEVYINYREIPEEDLDLSSIQKELKVVAAHEMGHILGLGHVDSTRYIMHDGYVSTQPTSPHDSEKSAVRDLYDYR